MFSVFQQRMPSGGKVFAVDNNERSYTYGELFTAAAQVAGLLRGLGLQAGDRVSVQVDKTLECVPLYLGILQAGLVYHPLNTAYTAQELDYFLGNAEPSVVIGQPERLEEYATLCRTHGVKHLYTLGPEQRGDLWPAVLSSPASTAVETRRGDDIAALLYSSGTTGLPKGVMLTHHNLLSNAEDLVELWGFSGADTLLHALPIYHVHGLFVALHCVLLSGASLRWLPRFEVTEVIRTLPQATVMMGVPTFYTRLLACAAFSREDCRRIRMFISGSAPLLESTFDAFLARTGQAILERYGMTETGMNTSNPLFGPRKVGTVGVPLPSVEVRIRDAHNTPIAPGEVGEIQVRGPNVFAGYWRMPDKTAADFTDDRWFITGDQGRFDDDGYLHIVGRSKDMIITGGLNVYPKEVETALNAFPSVLESAVLGVPDDDFGEAVVAVIVPQHSSLSPADVEQLRRDLSAHLARFKVPKTIKQIDSLPRNAMGKVQKALLRERWSTI
jgi:malonyl-CoA/methylmalonyl-CoA synthetase